MKCEVRRWTLPAQLSTNVCVCFAGNVFHPGKVRGAFSLMWIASGYAYIPGAIREAPLSIGWAVEVRPLLVDNIRFKPGYQHEKIGACVPLTTIIGA